MEKEQESDESSNKNNTVSLGEVEDALNTHNIDPEDLKKILFALNIISKTTENNIANNQKGCGTISPMSCTSSLGAIQEESAFNEESVNEESVNEGSINEGIINEESVGTLSIISLGNLSTHSPNNIDSLNERGYIPPANIDTFYQELTDVNNTNEPDEGRGR